MLIWSGGGGKWCMYIEETVSNESSPLSVLIPSQIKVPNTHGRFWPLPQVTPIIRRVII
jgi:hypothetical protein